MDHKPYELHVNEEGTRFQFQSIGKRGVFEKVVSIIPLSESVQNLALLDYDPITNEESDISVTDNGDMPEVLATTMKAINLFFEKYPDQFIYFKGSTRSRTRLYQISINKVYSNIQTDLVIYGWHNEEWTGFEPSLSFESFLIGKKH